MAFSSRRFVRAVRDAIVRHSMIRKGERVVVAVSGGPDSVALLYSLLSLREDIGFDLAACHLDHGFRGEESRKDARFVADLCSSVGVPCEIESEDVPALMVQLGVGPEEAGRIARYRFFDKTAARLGAHRVALGHTMDDQAETVLMRLIRGSGLDGLSGIPPVRGIYIRPLLYTTRSDIEQYCRSLGVEPRIDRTNLEPVYFRNQVRLEIVPLLERWNPRLKEILGGTAERLREDASYLEYLAREALDRLEEGGARGRHDEHEESGLGLRREEFVALPRALQRWVLRAAAREVAGDRAAVDPLGFTHVEAVIGLAETGREGASLDLPGGLGAMVCNGGRTLLIERVAAPNRRRANRGAEGLACPQPVTVPGVTDVPHLGIRVTAEVRDHSPCRGQSGVDPEIASNRDPWRAYLDYAVLERPLVVRSRADGDFFYPLGLGGGKKVGDFMTSLKIPLGERGRVPVFLSGGQVVWVGGYRIDERFKVTPRTRRVLTLAVQRVPLPDPLTEDSPHDTHLRC